MNNRCLCIFGEVLFDCFPDGKQVLGGAPFNVAWHLQAFAQSPRFISRVGNDAQGDSIRAAMQDWGMTTQSLQVDETRLTGRVNISFNDGEPDYEIVAECAYDAIAFDSQDMDCKLLYHGSLALRDTTNRNTLEQIKAGKPELVFVDVNLRPPWWRPNQIKDVLCDANWVKLNADELLQLSPGAREQQSAAADFLELYQLSGLIVTHGERGAEVLTNSGEHFDIQPAHENLNIVDTVGAGDAFASVMLIGLINHWELGLTLQRAQDFASKLVCNRGATVGSMDFYRPFIDQWRL